MLLDQRSAQTLYLQPIEPEATKAILRTYAEVDGPLEFPAEFIKNLQRELSQRFMILKAGMDDPTATDLFLYRILENGNLRLLKDN